jgi:hypothetical protein
MCRGSCRRLEMHRARLRGTYLEVVCEGKHTLGLKPRFIVSYETQG